jgi:hypothetical protein
VAKQIRASMSNMQEQIVHFFLVVHIRIRTYMITFLPAENTREFILRDPDGYLSHFDSTNMFSRGYPSDANPLRYIIDSALTASDFTLSERTHLVRSAAIADTLIQQRARHILGITNTQLLVNIPWIFAKTGTAYEMGLPHTRQGIIFPGSPLRTDPETLIHEKVHIFTRYYPDAAKSILARYGIVPIINTNPLPAQLRTRNPDIPRSTPTYWNSVSGHLYDDHYYNTNPASAFDTSALHPRASHPYEWLAYTVSEVCK